MTIALKAGPAPVHGRELAARILRWLGRGLAVLLALFWGAFLVEHINEWYVQPKGYPPLWVTVAMGFHLGLVAGLLLSLWWERLGILLILLSAIGFVITTGGNRAVTGIMLLNLAPIACYAAAMLLQHHAGPGDPAGHGGRAGHAGHAGPSDHAGPAASE